MRRSGASAGATATREVTKPDERWRQELTPLRYRVLRKAHTEMAFTGAYLHHHRDGLYRCAGCGARLFSPDAKFYSGTRLAELQPARGRRGSRVAAGQRPVPAAHRGRVPPLRRSPWPRLQRRPPAGRPAVLHQLVLAGVRARDREPAAGRQLTAAPGPARGDPPPGQPWSRPRAGAER